eukprot:g3740.t1
MADAPSSSKSECVKVVIRCRPLSQQEVADNRLKVVDIDVKQNSITCRKPNDPTAVKSFTFDAVYDQSSTQVGIYDETASIIVDSVLDGYNGTVFAYGQTGTGKTFTMVGVLEVEELVGMIPRAFEHIFRHIDTSGDKTTQFLVRASYLEIYNEEIRDLLSKNPKTKLELKDSPDSGVYVKDLSAFVVKGVDEMHQVMAAGTRNRSVGQTKMNETSLCWDQAESGTVMVANVGPVDYNYDETISTLRYAHRAKSIQNKPKINEDPKDAMLREFQEEIARLRRQVEMQQAGKTVILDEDGNEKVVEERIVEKIVEVEKDMGGATQADAEELHKRMIEEKAQMEADILAEREKIEQEKNLAEEEKEKLLQELIEKERTGEEARKQQAEMIQKVKQMEEKILAGSSVMEKAVQQEQELVKAQRAVQEMRRNEKKLAKLAEKNIDEKLMLQEKFNSVEEQVMKLTAKLEKLWERYQLAQQEIKDLQHDP